MTAIAQQTLMQQGCVLTLKISDLFQAEFMNIISLLSSLISGLSLTGV